MAAPDCCNGRKAKNEYKSAGRRRAIQQSIDLSSRAREAEKLASGAFRLQNRYSIVILSGDEAAMGGRAKVAIKLIANNATAVSSINAETGRTFHAHFA